MGAPLGAPVGSQHCKLLRIMVIGERGFEPPTPWSRKRDSGVVLNVFNLLQWCFDRLSPVQSPQSGVNVSPRMAVLHQGFGSPQQGSTIAAMAARKSEKAVPVLEGCPRS